MKITYKTILIQLFVFLIISIILTMPTYVFGNTNEILCMATNIYHEARGEPEAAQFMVGFVTMNRVRDPRWPNTVCKVVYQPGQFIWTKNKQYKPKGKLYNRIIEIASIVMQSEETEEYGHYFDKADTKPSRHRIIVGFHEFYDK